MKLIRHFRKYHNYLFVPPPPQKNLLGIDFCGGVGGGGGGGGGGGQKDNYNIF